MLFNTPQIEPFGSLSIPVVVLVSLLIAALFAFVITKALQTQVRQPFIGSEGMIGLEGRVVEALDPEGVVLVASERWRARATDGDAIPKDARIEVTKVDGFRVEVRLKALSPEGAGQESSESQTAPD